MKSFFKYESWEKFVGTCWTCNYLTLKPIVVNFIDQSCELLFASDVWIGRPRNS